jgi:hypothetical protein
VNGLAVERAGDMSERVAFLLPVVIDDTNESRADVPDRFREVQWTPLPGGETPPVFVDRVRRLLSGAESNRVWASVPARKMAPTSRWSRRALPVAAAVVIAGAFAYLVVDRHRVSRQRQLRVQAAVLTE